MYKTVSELGSSYHDTMNEAVDFAKDTLCKANRAGHVFVSDPTAIVYSSKEEPVGVVVLDSDGASVHVFSNKGDA